MNIDSAIKQRAVEKLKKGGNGFTRITAITKDTRCANDLVYPLIFTG